MFLLRVVHIFSGIIWVGFGFFQLGVVGPAVRSFGSEGTKFRLALSQKGRYDQLIAAAALLTTLSGLTLYYLTSGNLNPAVVFAPARLGLNVGALVGVAAFLHGFFSIGRKSARLQALVGQMQATGGPPQPAQLAEARALGTQIERGGRVSAILMVTAVIGMASVG
ncbi:MAG: hypothetical protein AB1791_18650 [Chloroflexota bacterium]